MARFEHRVGVSVACEEDRIWVEVIGAEADPALLLLHGGMGSVEDFNGVLERLTGRYRVIAVDAPGHGKSTFGGGAWTYERAQKCVEQVLIELGVKRLRVIGFSDGGIVGLRLAAAKRVAIDKLVVIGTPWELEEGDPSLALYAKITPQSWREKFPETYELYQRVNPEPDFDRLFHALLQGWSDTSEHGYPGESIGYIDAELLVVRGDDDHLVPRKSAFELTEHVPGAKLLSVPFAGHVAHDDQPEIVMKSVNQFLQTRAEAKSH